MMRGFHSHHTGFYYHIKSKNMCEFGIKVREVSPIRFYRQGQLMA